MAREDDLAYHVQYPAIDRAAQNGIDFPGQRFGIGSFRFWQPPEHAAANIHRLRQGIHARLKISVFRDSEGIRTHGKYVFDKRPVFEFFWRGNVVLFPVRYNSIIPVAQLEIHDFPSLYKVAYQWIKGIFPLVPVESIHKSQLRHVKKNGIPFLPVENFHGNALKVGFLDFGSDIQWVFVSIIE
jgi:hypothetical protein